MKNRAPKYTHSDDKIINGLNDGAMVVVRLVQSTFILNKIKRGENRNIFL